MASCTCLAAHSTTADVDSNVKLAGGVGDIKRQKHIAALCFQWEIFLEAASVHGYFPCASGQAHASYRGFSATGSQKISIFRHVQVMSIKILFLVDFHRLRLLRIMRMLSATVNFEFGQELAPQAVFGEHTLYCVKDQTIRMRFTHFRH